MAKQQHSDSFWSHFELPEATEGPHSPPIPTSAEISEAALSNDDYLLPDPRMYARRADLFEDIYWRIERTWEKYLVMGVIYGLGIFVWFVLTR